MTQSAETRLSGYALWLVPSSSVLVYFRDLIFRLASKYGAPPFQPHITLLNLGDVRADEAVTKATEVIQDTKSFEVTLSNFATLEAFYRCFFLEIEKNEKLDLLRERALSVFETAERNAYSPHLSLLYANMAQDEKRSLPQQTGIHVPQTIELSALRVISLNGEVKDWRIVYDFMLPKSTKRPTP